MPGGAVLGPKWGYRYRYHTIRFYVGYKRWYPILGNTGTSTHSYNPTYSYPYEPPSWVGKFTVSVHTLRARAWQPNLPEEVHLQTWPLLNVGISQNSGVPLVCPKSYRIP